jgi:hypothetical protein
MRPVPSSRPRGFGHRDTAEGVDRDAPASEARRWVGIWPRDRPEGRKARCLSPWSALPKSCATWLRRTGCIRNHILERDGVLGREARGPRPHGARLRAVPSDNGTSELA